MSELSERARELAEKYVSSACMEPCWCQYSENNGDDYVSCEDKLVELIEQALLAERRLAKLEDAEIALNERVEEVALSDAAYNMAIKHVVQALRAAAEKEVGTI